MKIFLFIIWQITKSHENKIMIGEFTGKFSSLVIVIVLFTIFIY